MTVYRLISDGNVGRCPWAIKCGAALDSAMDGKGQTIGVDNEQSEDDSGGALDAETW